VNVQPNPSSGAARADRASQDTERERRDVRWILVRVKEGYGPDQVMHYNGFPAAEIKRRTGRLLQLRQAQTAIARVLHDRLPASMSFEWDELGIRKYSRATDGHRVSACVLLVYVVLRPSTRLTLP